jgi:hypothetical protein
MENAGHFLQCVFFFDKKYIDNHHKKLDKHHLICYTYTVGNRNFPKIHKGDYRHGKE